MRLLVFSDLHLDAPFEWAPAAIGRTRRQALRQCLDGIVALALSQRVDAVCCAGDLYEQERFTPDTVAFVRDCFARLDPIPVFLAPGNHDWYGDRSLYRVAEFSPNVHIFTSDRLSPVPLAEGVTLWGAAHRAPANTRGFLDKFEVDREGVHIALFHGSEQGDIAFEESGKVAHAPFRAEQIRAAGLHHALVGHYHRPRDAVDHTYPGNPEPLTFGETGDRGAVIVAVDPDGVVTRERHRVAVTQVSDVEVRLDGVAHAGQVAERVVAALADVKGTVRVTLAGEVGPDVDVSPDALVRPEHIEAWVVRLGVVTRAYDLERLAGEPTVRGQFVRDVLAAAELDEDDRRRVLVTGLRAFDERHPDLRVR
jgi:DNA repair exonuclease SbcCD nuclease subunit